MRASHDLKRRPFQLYGFQLRRKEAPRQALSRPSGVVNFAESNKMGMTAIIVEADEKSTRPVDDIVVQNGGTFAGRQRKPSYAHMGEPHQRSRSRPYRRG